MSAILLHRILVAALALGWIAAWSSGMAVFRQKLTPEYHPLPGLIGRHARFGVVWAALLALAGLSGLARWEAGPPRADLALAAALSLALTASAVVYTGYGLRIGKPTGVWVHVGLGLIATGLGLGLLSQHLWNGLA